MLDDGEGSVRAMRCVQMELGEPDESGRRRPVPVPDSEFEFACDQVVFAIGTNANPIIGQTSKLALDSRGYLRVDDDLATSMAGVYAGGDIVTGAATVIEAMGAGRTAAASIKRYLGIRDAARRYDEPGNAVFGIAAHEHNYVRVRLVGAHPLPDETAVPTR
ncbi:MAG: FAD-dependent oxidoreductase [Nocardioides sp.]